MIKKICLLASVGSLILSTAQAAAEGRVYIKGEAGYALPLSFADLYYDKKKASGSANLGFAVGYEISPMFSADLQLYHLPSFDFDKILEKEVNETTQKFRSSVIFMNGNIMPYDKLWMKPFLTFGVGVAFNHAGQYSAPDEGLTYNSKTVRQFAWNVGAGLAYDLDSKTKLSLTYKYLNLGNAKNSNVSYSFIGGQELDDQPPKTKLRAHSLLLGVAYHF